MVRLEAQEEFIKRPEKYICGKSEEEPDEWDKVAIRDNFDYQDTFQIPFPFFIDATTLIFMGRVGEDPLSAHFTITNHCNEPFWFKVKCSNQNMFRVTPTIGRLQKDDTALIRVTFLPNHPRQKPFCQYLHIYALHDMRTEMTAYEAFTDEDRHRPEPRYRLYVDFIWHPNIGLTQALQHGRMIAAEGKMQNFDVIDVAYYQRQRVLEQLFELNRDELIKEEVETAPEQAERLKKLYKYKNCNRMETLLQNKNQPINWKKELCEKQDTPEETCRKMWECYMTSLKAKGYGNCDTVLNGLHQKLDKKMTKEERRKAKERRKNEMYDEERLAKLYETTLRSIRMKTKGKEAKDRKKEKKEKEEGKEKDKTEDKKKEEKEKDKTEDKKNEEKVKEKEKDKTEDKKNEEKEKDKTEENKKEKKEKEKEEEKEKDKTEEKKDEPKNET